MIQAIVGSCERELKCSDEKCLEILQARVIKTMPTDTSEALLQLDEAMEVIEDHDVKNIKGSAGAHQGLDGKL